MLITTVHLIYCLFFSIFLFIPLVCFQFLVIPLVFVKSNTRVQHAHARRDVTVNVHSVLSNIYNRGERDPVELSFSGVESLCSCFCYCWGFFFSFRSYI